MLNKNINIRFDARTFPNKKLPPNFKPGTASIDVKTALLMLGSVTVPGGVSLATPAIYWAWIRYFSAVSPHSQLKVTTAFAGLDPHQKTLLSDDFGVAMTMQWLNTAIGGFKQIVDGRRFALIYSHLLATPVPRHKKVGPKKTPDFVVIDRHGKWHVIECKGT